MPNPIPYKSFCWSLGTTSFRTKDFNRTIERQLTLLNEFWEVPENRNCTWAGNVALQTRYYDYMQQREFVFGNARNKPKDAREKTSGLVDIGLIDDNRHLTNAGIALLEICANNDFATDNFLQIPKDSYLYLKQLLKTSNCVNSDIVRPFIILLYALSRLDYLSTEEFTYLLPLCTNSENTLDIIDGIQDIRRGNSSQDDIILNRLMSMDNYQAALGMLRNNDVTENLLCEIGLNRKSREYDKPYFNLYIKLYNFYINADNGAFAEAYSATKNIKIGKLWREYIFNTASEVAIRKNPQKCRKTSIFDSANNENEFKFAFFKVMHLLKAKATLSDYFDLNRRYIKTTDIVLFEDDTIKLDIIPKYFFNSIIVDLYKKAYIPTPELVNDGSIENIDASLAFNEQVIINGVNAEFHATVNTIADVQNVLADIRYRRLQHLIDTKFSDDKLLILLNCFETRNDNQIRDMVTDNADVPTIFEYVLAILWYKVSERHGKILDYMKLSLDADLLPKTHASGGEADIVYEYNETDDFPAHTLLLEATLSDGTNQRRMEMEPVSRHLGQHLIRTGNLNSYCVFASNDLDINVISDFRNRRTTPYYNPQDTTQYVGGMKIIPIKTAELKNIITHQKKYKDLYEIFDSAFKSTLQVHEWYDSCVRNMI